MKKTSDKAIDNNKAELAEWEEELARLQSLTPVQAARDQLKAKELPAMEEEIKRLETDHPAISSRAEEVGLFTVVPRSQAHVFPSLARLSMSWKPSNDS